MEILRHAETSSETNEIPALPEIDESAARQIDRIGGEFQGFVVSPDSRRFSDFLVERRGFADPVRRSIVEVFVSTEAIDEDGNADTLGRPEDVDGYRILIVETDAEGVELEDPRVLNISRMDFAAPLDRTALRAVAHDIHRTVLEHLAHNRPRDLNADVLRLLKAQGYRSEKMPEG